MGYPTFSLGDKWEPTDANAVGLWKITSVNLSLTSVVVSNCFSSNYDNYRLVIDGIGSNPDGALLIQMTSGGSAPSQGWQWAYRGLYANGSSADVSLGSSTYAETGAYTGVANSPIGSVSMDIFNPNRPQRTFVLSNAISYAGVNFFIRNGGGACDTTAVYDGFRLYFNSGATFTHGKVTVYGYRK